MDAITKSLIALMIALTLCAGFLIGKIGADWFASIATFVLGAIFGRAMGMLPLSTSTIKETDPTTGKVTETKTLQPLMMAAPPSATVTAAPPTDPKGDTP